MEASDTCSEKDPSRGLVPREEGYAKTLLSLARCPRLLKIAEAELNLPAEELQGALLEGARRLSSRKKRLKAFIDGASRGNPGKAGAGVVIYDEKGKMLQEEFLYLGEATNNVAEYRALLLAIQMAEQRNAEELKVFSDSKLIVRQVTGQYRVTNPALMKLHSEVKERIRHLNYFCIEQIPREENRIADNLANKAIDMAPE